MSLTTHNNFLEIKITFILRTVDLLLGLLRPHKTSPARTVPDHIPRPDYADHPEGIPLTEQLVKLSSVIKVLNDEEQEEMKIACKVLAKIKCTNIVIYYNISN